MYFTGNLQLIYREKLTGGGNHFGVLLPNQVCIDLGPNGIRTTTLSLFANGKQVYKEKEIPYTSEVQSRLQNLIEGKSNYSLLDFNCEHFARYLVEGKKESKQLVDLGYVASLMAILFLLSSD